MQKLPNVQLICFHTMCCVLIIISKKQIASEFKLKVSATTFNIIY